LAIGVLKVAYRDVGTVAQFEGGGNKHLHTESAGTNRNIGMSVLWDGRYGCFRGTLVRTQFASYEVFTDTLLARDILRQRRHEGPGRSLGGRQR